MARIPIRFEVRNLTGEARAVLGRPVVPECLKLTLQPLEAGAGLDRHGRDLGLPCLGAGSTPASSGAGQRACARRRARPRPPPGPHPSPSVLGRLPPRLSSPQRGPFPQRRMPSRPQPPAGRGWQAAPRARMSPSDPRLPLCCRRRLGTGCGLDLRPPPLAGFSRRFELRPSPRQRRAGAGECLFRRLRSLRCVRPRLLRKAGVGARLSSRVVQLQDFSWTCSDQAGPGVRAASSRSSRATIRVRREARHFSLQGCHPLMPERQTLCRRGLGRVACRQRSSTDLSRSRARASASTSPASRSWAAASVASSVPISSLAASSLRRFRSSGGLPVLGLCCPHQPIPSPQGALGAHQPLPRLELGLERLPALGRETPTWLSERASTSGATTQSPRASRPQAGSAAARRAQLAPVQRCGRISLASRSSASAAASALACRSGMRRRGGSPPAGFGRETLQHPQLRQERVQRPLGLPDLRGSLPAHGFGLTRGLPRASISASAASRVRLPRRRELLAGPEGSIAATAASWPACR